MLQSSKALKLHLNNENLIDYPLENHFFMIAGRIRSENYS